MSSRIENILQSIIDNTSYDEEVENPSRIEKLLLAIKNNAAYSDEARSRIEALLLAIKNNDDYDEEIANPSRVEEILLAKIKLIEYKKPAQSRIEKLLIKWLYQDLYFIISGIPPFIFEANGQPLIDWTIWGNMVQDGTPSVDNPITPSECGDLETTGEHTGQYKIPILSANTTTNIYLSEPIRKIGDYADKVEGDTVTRNIKKLVLDGTESWTAVGEGNTRFFYTTLSSMATTEVNPSPLISSHFELALISSTSSDIGMRIINGSQLRVRPKNVGSTTVANFKQWLSENIPSIWYVLATPTTETISAPTIPTANGTNNLAVGTTVQPSNMEITYAPKEPDIKLMMKRKLR